MPLPRREATQVPYFHEFGRPNLPRTLGESVTATMADPRNRPSELILEGAAEQLAGEAPRPRGGKGGIIGAAPGIAQLPPPPKVDPKQKELMSPEQVDAEFGHLGVKFTTPTPRIVAEMTAKRRQEDQFRNEIVSASPQGISDHAVRFGAGMLSGVPDPLNILSGFVPGFRAATSMKILQGATRVLGPRAGSIAGKAVTGTAAGITGTLAVSPPSAIISNQLQLDYSMNDVLFDFAFGGALGAAGGAVAGALDRTPPAFVTSASREAKEGFFRGAVSQFLNGDPVNVQPIHDVDSALARMEPEGERNINTLTKEQRALAVEQNRQGINRMAQPESEWKAPPEPADIKKQYTEVEIDEFSEEAFEALSALEDAMVEARNPEAEPAPKAEKPAKKGPKPVDAFQYLQGLGGIRDDGGNLAAMNISKKKGWYGIISDKGMSPDDALQRLVEGGYLDPNDPDLPPVRTLQDVYDILSEHQSGRPTYSKLDDKAVAEMKGLEAEEIAAAERDMMDADLEHYFQRRPKELARLTDSERVRAYELSREEMHPDDILERIAMESEAGPDGLPIVGHAEEGVPLEDFVSHMEDWEGGTADEGMDEVLAAIKKIIGDDKTKDAPEELILEELNDLGPFVADPLGDQLMAGDIAKEVWASAFPGPAINYGPFNLYGAGEGQAAFAKMVAEVLEASNLDNPNLINKFAVKLELKGLKPEHAEHVAKIMVKHVKGEAPKAAAAATGWKPAGDIMPSEVRKATADNLAQMLGDIDRSKAVYGKDATGVDPLAEMARQARREQMGYTQIAFRGGSYEGSKSRALQPRQRSDGTPGAVFFSDKFEIANKYSPEGRGVVYPVYLRTKGFLEVDWRDRFGTRDYDGGHMNELIKEARKDGYPGIIAKNISDIGGTQTQYIVLDGSAIRGWHARFDPEERFSSDYMAKVDGWTEVEGETPRLPAETAKIAADIVKRLPKEVQVKMGGTIPSQMGGTVRGAYFRSAKILQVTKHALDPVGVLRHEEIHALRNLGLIGDDEWRVLTARARGILNPQIETNYRGWFERQFPNDPAKVADKLAEEAVAHLVEKYKLGERFGPGIDGILKRIIEFFERLKNAAKGAGFQSFDDIMRRIETGEVGARKRQAVAKEMGMAAAEDGITPDQQSLLDMVERKASPEEIQEHPLIKQFTRSAAAIPDRTNEKGYRSPAWKAKADYVIDGVPVTGWDEAVNGLTFKAASYARGEVANERKAVIVMGAPAAGKNAIAEELAPMLRAALPDPDDAKKIIPGYNDGIGSSSVHKESNNLYGDVVKRMMADGTNMVIPKVGYWIDSITNLADRLHKNGYRVEIVLMDVNPDEAFRRAIKRFIDTGRLVTPKYVIDVDGLPRRNYDKLKRDGYAEAFAEIDNNGKEGDPRAVTGDALSDLRGLREGGGGRFLGGDERKAQEVSPEIISELTPFGEQLVIPGTEQREPPKKADDGKLKAKGEQKSSPGPLFEDQQMDLVEQARLARADQNVTKAQAMEKAVMQAARCLSMKGLL
jgi:predicted kinase